MRQPTLFRIPRAQVRRPGRSTIYGWRFRVVSSALPGGRSPMIRVGSSVFAWCRYADDPRAVIMATGDQGRTWSPATSDQLLALKRDAVTRRKQAGQ